MSTAAPTFAEPDSDAWGVLAASPLAPSRRRAIFGTVLAVSLIAHGITVLLFLAADSLDGRLVTTVREIPVELVKEMPEAKPSSDAARGKTAGEKGGAPGSGAASGADAAAKATAPPSAAKPEPRKADAATALPAAAAADAAKPEQPQPPAAPLRPQPEAVKSEPAKSETAKPATAKPAAAAALAPVPAPNAAAARPAPQQAAAVPPVPPRSALPALSMPTAFGPLPGSFNAVVLPATTIGGQEAVSYRALVFSQIAKAKRFPEAARARGASGVAVVSFSVDDTGNPVGVTLAHSSGDPDIDAEIVAMVGRAAPFPPPPQGAQRSFSAAIEFGHDE